MKIKAVKTFQDLLMGRSDAIPMSLSFIAQEFSRKLVLMWHTRFPNNAE